MTRLLGTSVPFAVPDAVAVIVQLARSPQTGRPSNTRLSTDHVWLGVDGTVVLSPGILPTRAEVGVLLDELLSVIQETQPDSVPHALQFIVDRAAGQLADTTMPSLTAFAAALEPFQPPDPAAAIAALVETAAEAPTLVQFAVQPVTPSVAQREPEPDTELEPEIESEPEVDLEPVAIAGVANAPPRQRRWGRLAVATIAACLIAALVGARVANEVRDEVPVLADAATPDDAAGSEVLVVMTVEPAHEVPAVLADGAPAGHSEGAGGVRANNVPVALGEPARVPADAMPRKPTPLVAARSADAEGVFSPSFSGSGSAVFFHAETASGSALKRADAGERGELRIATIVDDGARNYHVQLSPTGTSVAFDSDRDGVRGVYVATAEGRDVHRVSGPGYAAVPTWAPDGDRLAFIRGEADRPAVWNLWLLDVQTGRQSRLTSFARGQVWGATWFVDGRRVAFSHEDRLTIRDLDSGGSRDFTSPIAGRQVRTPAVSPDGRWIVFQVARDGVWLLEVERGFMQRILQDASAEEFTWSPDGSRVAFHSRRSGGWGLWTMAGP
ncbi:MAG: hypothetical protein ABIU38_03565 [Vicinamibacteraceae bacterium]